jgi:hypothetical protein
MPKNTPAPIISQLAPEESLATQMSSGRFRKAGVKGMRGTSGTLALNFGKHSRLSANRKKRVAIQFTPAARRGRTAMADEAGHDRPDYLKAVTFQRPSSLALTFPDRTFLLAIERLEMPMDQFRWETVKAHPAGNAMTVKARNGEVMPVDSSVLRYLVDAKYAAKVSAELAPLRFSREELEELSRNSERPSWF